MLSTMVHTCFNALQLTIATEAIHNNIQMKKTAKVPTAKAMASSTKASILSSWVAFSLERYEGKKNIPTNGRLVHASKCTIQKSTNCEKELSRTYITI